MRSHPRRADRLQNPTQVGRADGLDEIFHRPELRGASFVLFLLRAAEDNDLDRRTKSLSPYPLHDLKAVEDRHFQIQKHYRGNSMWAGTRSIAQKLHGRSSVCHMVKGAANV